MIATAFTFLASIVLFLYSIISPQRTTLKSGAQTIDPSSQTRVQHASGSATVMDEGSLFTYIPTPTPTSVRRPIAQPTQPDSGVPQDWGVAKPIGNGTYTIKINYDGAMTSPSEFVAALNQYRATHGSGALTWDDALGNYAAGRAQTFKSIQKTDTHAGFNDFLNNQNGFATLKFSRLGENSYYGGPVTGTHVVEWVFAQSPGHNANQLDPSWTHIGVGVTETSIDIIFGGSRM